MIFWQTVCLKMALPMGDGLWTSTLLGMTPREYGRIHMKELRQELLKNDLYIIGCRNEDEKDLARTAAVSASSEKTGYEAYQVVSGVTRRECGDSNMWSSDGMSPHGESLKLKLHSPSEIREVRLVLDPNLSEERCISVSKAFLEKEPLGVAEGLLLFRLKLKNIKFSSQNS